MAHQTCEHRGEIYRKETRRILGHGWQIRSRDWRTVDLKVQIRPNLGDVLFQFVQLFRLGQTDSDTVRSNLYFLCENYIVS